MVVSSSGGSKGTPRGVTEPTAANLLACSCPRRSWGHVTYYPQIQEYQPALVTLVRTPKLSNAGAAGSAARAAACAEPGKAWRKCTCCSSPLVELSMAARICLLLDPGALAGAASEFLTGNAVLVALMKGAHYRHWPHTEQQPESQHLWESMVVCVGSGNLRQKQKKEPKRPDPHSSAWYLGPVAMTKLCASPSSPRRAKPAKDGSQSCNPWSCTTD